MKHKFIQYITVIYIFIIYINIADQSKIKLGKLKLRNVLENNNVKFTNNPAIFNKNFLNLSLSIFVSGLYDKIFIFTFLFAYKYNAMMVFTTTYGTLIIMSCYSAKINLFVNNFCDYLYIDIFIIVLLLVIGIRLLNEGFLFDKITAGALSNFFNLSNNNGINNIHSNNTIELYDNFWKKLSCSLWNNFINMLKIIGLVTILEMGDKTQINTVLVPSNKIIAVYAILIANFSLIFIAVIGGRYLSSSKFISEKLYYNIAGFIFLLFTFISIYLTFNLDNKKLTPIHVDKYINFNQISQVDNLRKMDKDLLMNFKKINFIPNKSDLFIK